MPPSLIFQASAAPQSDQPLCGGPADLLEMTLCEQIRRPKKPSFGLQPKATKTASVAKRAPNAAPAKAKSGKKASAAKKAPKSLNVPNLAPIAPSRLRSAPFFVPSRVLTPPQRAPLVAGCEFGLEAFPTLSETPGNHSKPSSKG